MIVDDARPGWRVPPPKRLALRSRALALAWKHKTDGLASGHLMERNSAYAPQFAQGARIRRNIHCLAGSRNRTYVSRIYAAVAGDLSAASSAGARPNIHTVDERHAQ